MNIREEYKKRKEMYLDAMAIDLRVLLKEQLEVVHRIDNVIVRAKGVAQFVKKASKKENRKQKYQEPLVQIQDQIGARIVVFYLSDLTLVEKKIKKYYNRISERKLIPESDSEFGYVGKHYVLKIPKAIINGGIDKNNIPQFFELQIHTLFQHAWSEASHDLDYKPNQCITSAQKRKIAYTAAQAWGADHIFLEILKDLKKTKKTKKK